MCKSLLLCPLYYFSYLIGLYQLGYQTCVSTSKHFIIVILQTVPNVKSLFNQTPLQLKFCFYYNAKEPYNNAQELVRNTPFTYLANCCIICTDTKLSFGVLEDNKFSEKQYMFGGPWTGQGPHFWFFQALPPVHAYNLDVAPLNLSYSFDFIFRV